MTANAPLVDSNDLSWAGELQLNPQTHGKGRVPGPKTVGFDLQEFGRARRAPRRVEVRSAFAADRGCRPSGRDRRCC